MNNQPIFIVNSLNRYEDLQEVLTLQNLVFGEANPTHLSLQTLIDYQHNGQHLLGIFDRGQLFGFLVAWLGTYAQNHNRPAMSHLKLVLERIAIHPDYRNSGLATQLLHSLYEIANKQAIRLVTSVFSPLNGRMASLMVNKMGGLGRYYLPDHYPTQAMNTSPVLTSSQLEIEWWITQNRVVERLFGKRCSLTLTQYLQAQIPIINPSGLNNGVTIPMENSVKLADESMILVEIPLEYAKMTITHPKLAEAWSLHIDSIFRQVFQMGYVITDFLMEEWEGRLRGFYLFSWDGPGQFENNGENNLV
jgi:predicted GNAT superfamily acetyltransferase